MQYVKLWDGLLMSSINEAELYVRWLWVTLLVAADGEGMVYGTVNALARMANLTEVQTSDALDILMAPDPSSTTGDEAGRRILNPEPNRWLIVNYTKYRAMKSPKEEREKVAERVRRYRERRVTGVTGDVTSSNAVKPQGEGEGEGEGVKTKKGRFAPPALEEAISHIQEKKYHFSGEAFWNYYESVGWKVGNKPMKKWRQACVTWETRWKNDHPELQPSRRGPLCTKCLFRPPSEDPPSQFCPSCLEGILAESKRMGVEVE